MHYVLVLVLPAATAATTGTNMSVMAAVGLVLTPAATSVLATQLSRTAACLPLPCLLTCTEKGLGSARVTGQAVLIPSTLDASILGRSCS